MKIYTVKCRKTGRKFAAPEEYIRELIENHTNPVEKAVLEDRFKNLKDGDELCLLANELIMPGETNAPDAV